VNETLDGDGGGNGKTVNTIEGDIATVVYGGTIHAFYIDSDDGDLRHIFWTGTEWIAEVLDGNVATGGRITSRIDLSVEAIVRGGQLSVFYEEAFGNIRHMYSFGSSWTYEFFDGPNAPAGAGRTGNSLGLRSLKATVFRGSPVVVYRDTVTDDLRLAHAAVGGLWAYSVLDGDSLTGGRTTNDVGQVVSMYADKSGGTPVVRVLYQDAITNDVRHAYSSSLTTAFNYEVFDGSVSGVVGSASFVAGPSYGSAWSSALGASRHFFYTDVSNGDLRHAFTVGNAWYAETFDGNGPTPTPITGRTQGNVGSVSSTVYLNGVLHVFYYDIGTGGTRHAFAYVG